MGWKKIIFNDLDLHGLGNKRFGMEFKCQSQTSCFQSQEVKGMTGKEGIDTCGLVGLVEDQVGDVFGVCFLKMLAQ